MNAVNASPSALFSLPRRAAHTLVQRTQQALRDAVSGFVELLHNGFALVGLAVVLLLAIALARPDLQAHAEQELNVWLQTRLESRAGMEVEPDAVDRATAALVKSLPKEQAKVALWLAGKYRVAPEPIAALVTEAHDLAKTTKIDAHLILAIAAVESSFNPFAQSPVGAQGLMQVMTNIHADKYQHYGGKLAAFDPITNLRVGVKVLQECIKRAGSLDAGLKYYVGAALHDTDGGYASKVYAEAARLREVATGRQVPYLVASSGLPPSSAQNNPSAGAGLAGSDVAVGFIRSGNEQSAPGVPAAASPTAPSTASPDPAANHKF